MKPLNILVNCETSGAVRDVLRTLGHDAVSCDLLPTKRPGPHYQGDARVALRLRRWDMLIAHPPCTYLTVSGRRWYYHPDDRHLPIEQRRPHPDYPHRREQEEAGAAFFMEMAHAEHIPLRCVENPIGVMSTRYRTPDQVVPPYQFGDDASKATCLWLYGLEPLPVPARELWFPPRMVYSPRHKKVLPRWGNQADGGGPSLGPCADRWDIRSATYPGIAAAMGVHWGT